MGRDRDHGGGTALTPALSQREREGDRAAPQLVPDDGAGAGGGRADVGGGGTGEGALHPDVAGARGSAGGLGGGASPGARLRVHVLPVDGGGASDWGDA